jgi:hypothetical protein
MVFYWSNPQQPPNDIKIIVDFGNNKLGTGDSFASRMIFNTPGQSATLVYLCGGGIGTSNGIWQIRSSGAYV